MSTPERGDASAWAALVALVALSAALRWHWLVGWGVTTDDLIYAGMANNMARGGWQTVDLRYGVNYRLGLTVPVAYLFRAFGVSDVTFVIYPFVMSLVAIVVVFLIGRRLFGATAGLTAALLLATCPFDVVFGSSMTIDVITSALSAIVVLMFLVGREGSVGRCAAAAAVAAASMLLAYMIKEPAIYLLGCLAPLTLLRLGDRRVVVRDGIFYCVVVAVLAATFVADYWVMGDALNRYRVQIPQSGAASGPFAETLLQYPRWIWLRTPEGTMSFGYLFYAAVPALLYVVARRPRWAHVPIVWLLGLVLLLEFFPKQWSPLVLAPRYPRYAHAWIAPAALVVAAALERLRHWRPSAFVTCLAVLVVSGLIEARTLHRVWTEPHSDRNDAAKFLATLPAKPVYSDYFVTGRYSFDMQYGPTRTIPDTLDGKPLQMGVIEKDDYAALWTIKDAYVVTGGSRGVDVGMMAILNLKGNTPPPTWHLLKEIPRPLSATRLEPVRVWQVTPDGADRGQPPGGSG